MFVNCHSHERGSWEMLVRLMD
ncbi:hypothetical protein MASSI9I_10333 [Massilia sp. 9I]|nr:hypothetical protein MASSI9I_10333 [Massilia sp. 9I]